MKMKDQGIRMNKSFFLNTAALDKLGRSLPNNFMLDGRIEKTPWKEQSCFILSWSLGTSAPPVELELGDLLLSISKGDTEMVKKLKSGREAFDLHYPGKEKAPKTKKAKVSNKKMSRPLRPSHTPQPRESVRVGLITLRMSPELNSPTRSVTIRPHIASQHVPPPVTGEDGESDSDEGSECPIADPDTQFD